jgi:hypothetical protein
LLSIAIVATARQLMELVPVKRLGKLFASCLSVAALTQLDADPVAAQSLWSNAESGSSWSRPEASYDYRPRPSAPPGTGYHPVYPGLPGGHPGYRPPHGHGDYPFDDVNLGIILSPDWAGGWNSANNYAPNSASGGYYAPGGEASGQPLLNQPPFYSGQPAPNFYQSPAPITGQSQYLTPRSGQSSPTPVNSLDGNSSGITAGSGESTARRRSILVRPESDPTLSESLAAGSAAAADYETSRAAFASGDYHTALAAAISASAADPANGKLQLYVAQCHFAVGEFEQSAATLSKAFQLLPPEQWGLVIENFRQFYKRNDYVKQFEQLLSFTEQSGQQQLGAALQAYHYRYLGHPDAAAEQLQVALRSSAPPQLASELKSLIQSAATTAAPLPAPTAGN